MLPDSGRVVFDGRDITALDDTDRARLRAGRIGVVLQSGNLIPFLTAVENVELAIELAGGGRPGGTGAGAALEVGLGHRLDHLPRRMSGRRGSARLGGDGAGERARPAARGRGDGRARLRERGAGHGRHLRRVAGARADRLVRDAQRRARGTRRSAACVSSTARSAARDRAGRHRARRRSRSAYATPAGPVRAVDGITLEVEPGSGLAITGPSGCGKSTLLGLIAASRRPPPAACSIGGPGDLEPAERERARSAP